MLFLKRFTLFIVALSVVAGSITISGLNTDKILIDFYFFKYEFSTGFALILAVFTGLIIGLIMALMTFYMPLKAEIRKLNRANRELTRQNLNNQRLEHTND